MKKNITVALALTTLIFVSNIYPGDEVYINMQELFRNTKEGRLILSQNEKAKEDLLSLEYQESKKIEDFRKNVEEDIRNGKIDEEELQDKQMEMASIQKHAKRSVDDKKEELEMETQKRMLKYKNDIFVVAQEVMQSEGWGAVKDSGAPGIVCVSPEADKTKVVLTAVNEQYDKKRIQSSLKKNNKIS